MRRTSRPEPWLGLLVASFLLLSNASRAEDGHAGSAGPRALEVTAGLRAVHRSLEYHDTPAERYPRSGYDSLASYKQPLAPAFFVRADLFPFAFSERGPLANIGLSASYEKSLGTRAVFAEGTDREITLDSASSELLVGLRGRLPLGVHELGLTAGLGEHTYTLKGDDGTPLVPDVDYTFARLSGDASFRLGALTLGFHVGTRLVRETGGLQRDWFPRARTQSIEAGLLFGYQVAPSVEVVAGFDLIRYAFDFNPIPANADPAYVAGGAVDQYTSGWLGVRFNLQGQAAEGNSPPSSAEDF